ncbi:hypothetical protein ACSFA2_03750 [Variovorax sp. LT2P21]|uniref:hypothetical protein n=1 Tax=Variovorax sp. LT2P21 TaxID=3443731 RepID=UPI003F47F214
MAKYRVQGPDGAIHVFEGPEGASQADVLAFAQQQFGKPTASPAAAPAAPAFEDPGVLKAGVIGAGKTFDSMLDGLTQMWLASRGETSAMGGLKQNVDEKAAIYKPLADAHPIATAVGEAAPGMVIPVGGGATAVGTGLRLAAAGGIPGALEYGSAGERAGRAAFGATAGVVGGQVLPAAGRAVLEAVPAIGRTAKALTEPLYASGREAIAGRTLARAAGEGAQDVAQRLSNAAELVPGSLPTAAQVAENGGIAALERSVAAAQPAAFAERGMQQAASRTQALRGIAQDDTARAAAVAAREAATSPLYAQATRANYTVDPALERLLQTPAMQQALKRAEELAANNQRTFSFDVRNTDHFSGLANRPSSASRQITGQGLQDLKMAVDAMLTDPASGYAGSAGNSVKALRGQLLNWMEGANPAYRTARTTFADMSKPIGQMDVGKKLLTDLEPALNDFGGLASETASKFANAMRNADQTAIKATKFKGAGMRDLMTPDQMGALEGIAGDLARKTNAQNLGRGPGSDTFQKLSMSNIAQQSGAPGVVGGALNLPGVSKVAKFLYSEPEEKIQSLLAQALLDPKIAGGLMSRTPAAVKPISAANLLFANPTRPAQLLGGAAGLSTANLLSQ